MIIPHPLLRLVKGQREKGKEGASPRPVRKKLPRSLSPRGTRASSIENGPRSQPVPVRHGLVQRLVQESKRAKGKKKRTPMSASKHPHDKPRHRPSFPSFCPGAKASCPGTAQIQTPRPPLPSAQPLCVQCLDHHLPLVSIRNHQVAAVEHLPQCFHDSVEATGRAALLRESHNAHRLLLPVLNYRHYFGSKLHFLEVQICRPSLAVALHGPALGDSQFFAPSLAKTMLRCLST